eukprot:5453537-Alexandrium_andersonii.AAC.1
MGVGPGATSVAAAGPRAMGCPDETLPAGKVSMKIEKFKRRGLGAATPPARADEEVGTTQMKKSAR